MSLFANGPAAHAANPPESWQVVKLSERRWALATKDAVDPVRNAGERLDTFKTKREAEEAKVSGFMAKLWAKESHWYAGTNVPGWKPWAELEAKQASRMTPKRAPIIAGMPGDSFTINPTPAAAERAGFDARANRALRGTATGESMAAWGQRYLREARAMLTLTQYPGTLWERVSH